MITRINNNKTTGVGTGFFPENYNKVGIHLNSSSKNQEITKIISFSQNWAGTAEQLSFHPAKNMVRHH